MNSRAHWASLKKGNKHSLEWIYRTYAPQLLQYGYALTPDQTMVEDCLQELFIRLWEKRDTLGETNSIKNYLFASLRRSIWKKAKKELRNTNIEDTLEIQFDLEPNIEQQKINEEIKTENALKLEKATTQLSARQKEVLYLKFTEDLTYEDIGSAMGINYQSVRNLVSSGLKVLRKNMMVLLLCISFISMSTKSTSMSYILEKLFLFNLI